MMMSAPRAALGFDDQRYWLDYRQKSSSPPADWLPFRAAVSRSNAEHVKLSDSQLQSLQRRSAMERSLDLERQLRLSRPSDVELYRRSLQAKQYPSAYIPPIFRLPTEVRREIFRYLLPSTPKDFRMYTDVDTTIINMKGPRRFQAKPDFYALSILRVNWYIYYEALEVLYSEKIFHFIGFNYSPVLDFIRRLGADAKKLIRRVRITLIPDDLGGRPSNHDLLCTVIHDYLPGLHTLHADPWIWMD